MDEAKRMELWHKADHILYEDQPYTFLAFRKSLLFIDKRFDNVREVKEGLNPNVEWFVPRAERRWETP